MKKTTSFQPQLVIVHHPPGCMVAAEVEIATVSPRDEVGQKSLRRALICLESTIGMLVEVCTGSAEQIVPIFISLCCHFGTLQLNMMGAFHPGNGQILQCHVLWLLYTVAPPTILPLPLFFLLFLLLLLKQFFLLFKVRVDCWTVLSWTPSHHSLERMPIFALQCKYGRH